jgi:hypothetical protein
MIDPTPPHQQGCGIIEANMQCNRIPDDGFPLLAVAPYQEVGVDRARAVLKSRFIAEFASAIIRTDYPKLADKLHVAGLSFPGRRQATCGH